MLERIKARHNEVMGLIAGLAPKDQCIGLHVYHGAYQEHKHINGSYRNIDPEEYLEKMIERANFMEKNLIDYIHATHELENITENFSDKQRGMIFSAFNNAAHEYNDTTKIGRVEFMKERAQDTIYHILEAIK